MQEAITITATGKTVPEVCLAFTYQLMQYFGVEAGWTQYTISSPIRQYVSEDGIIMQVHLARHTPVSAVTDE